MAAATSRSHYILGVDLGGTKIMCGALSEDGTRHLAMRSIPTQSEQGESITTELVDYEC